MYVKASKLSAPCRRLLGSHDVVRAVWSVVQRQAPALPALQRKQHTPRSIANTLVELAKHLIFVRSCSMRLMLQGPGQTIARDITLHGVPQSTFRMRCARTNHLVIATPPPSSSVAAELATAISYALGSPVQLQIVDILASPVQTTSAIARPALELYESASVAGQPGMSLQPWDVSLLQLLPLRSYRAGEMVAVLASAIQSTMPSAAAAAAAMSRSALANERSSEESYVLARVVSDCAPTEGAMVYEVFVETAPWSSQTLLSSEVYSFQDAGNDASSSAPSTIADARQPDMRAQGALAPEGRGLGMSTHQRTEAEVVQPADDGSGIDAGFSQSAAPQAARRVGNTDAVKAVTQMLAAAGLPLDLDRQKLMEQFITMRDARSAVEQRLSNIQVRNGVNQAWRGNSAQGLAECSFSRQLELFVQVSWSHPGSFISLC